MKEEFDFIAILKYNTYDEGLEFKFCEGRTIVGYGTILKISNEKLIRK